MPASSPVAGLARVGEAVGNCKRRPQAGQVTAPPALGSSASDGLLQWGRQTGSAWISLLGGRGHGPANHYPCCSVEASPLPPPERVPLRPGFARKAGTLFA